MTNLTLTAEELHRLKKAFALVSIVVTCVIALIQWRFFNSASLSSVPKSISFALTVTSGLFYVFYRWGWRTKWIAKWMGRPVVHGVWLGYLSSDFGRLPTDEPLRKPIVFVIRQTYLTLSIQSFTDSQVGESKLEALIRNARTDATRIAYVFELKNEYPGARKLTNGAGDLQLLADDSALKGTYWTSNPTHGTLSLRLQSDKCDGIQQFSDATRRWPVGALWKAS
jgi:hypothetical protein